MAHSLRGEGSVRRFLPATLVLGVAVVALAGCGGGEKAVSCGGKPVSSLPASFPSGLPVPDHFRLASVENDNGYVVAHGSAAGTLENVRDFYASALPRAGYTLGEGDAEKQEAETDFDGNGVAGRLKLDGGSGCVAVQLAVKEG
jgi:hypothetical protein